jgi:hypothetical protein
MQCVRMNDAYDREALYCPIVGVLGYLISVSKGSVSHSIKKDRGIDTTVIRRRLAKFMQLIWKLDFGLRCRCEILSPIGPCTFSNSHL